MQLAIGSRVSPRMKRIIVLVVVAGAVTWFACGRHATESTRSASHETIRTAMHAELPRITACFENNDAVPPVLHVTATLVVSRDNDLGTRVDAVVHADDGTALPHDFARCMRDALEALDLPTPDHAYHVSYPLTFRRAGV